MLEIQTAKNARLVYNRGMSFKPSFLFLSVLLFHFSLNAATIAQTKTEDNGEGSKEINLIATEEATETKNDQTLRNLFTETPAPSSKSKRDVVSEETVKVPVDNSVKRGVADSERVETSPTVNHSSTSQSKSPPKRTTASRSGDAPSGPSQGQRMQKHEALRHLSERVADLFACVPVYKDPDYSTQSWYLVDTFKAWNNAIADSAFESSEGFEDLQALFKSKAIAALNQRNPSLAANPAVLSYIADAALAADNIYKTASTKKQRSNSFSDTTQLLKNSSRAGGKNIFQYLKDAHSTSVSEIKKNKCTQLGKNFFSTPTFRAQALPKRGLVTHKISDRPKFIQDAQKIENKHLQYDAKINASYPKSKFVTAQLPIATAQNMKNAGYYSAGQFRAARPHVIGNILKAANRLKAQGIHMGVGDINQLGTMTKEKVKTPGFRGRDHGLRATLMTQNSKGAPSSCDRFAAPCYDISKTLTMLKVLIDRDPDNIKRIECNDQPLRNELINYLVNAHGYKRFSAEWIIRENKEYSNVISYEWDH